jgi:hypothetical protein
VNLNAAPKEQIMRLAGQKWNLVSAIAAVPGGVFFQGPIQIIQHETAGSTPTAT